MSQGPSDFDSLPAGIKAAEYKTRRNRKTAETADVRFRLCLFADRQPPLTGHREYAFDYLFDYPQKQRSPERAIFKASGLPYSSERGI